MSKNSRGFFNLLYTLYIHVYCCSISSRPVTSSSMLCGSFCTAPARSATAYVLRRPASDPSPLHTELKHPHRRSGCQAVAEKSNCRTSFSLRRCRSAHKKPIEILFPDLYSDRKQNTHQSPMSLPLRFPLVSSPDRCTR